MSYRSGRAVSQLADRSALRRLQRLGLPPAAALLSIPQPAAASPPVGPKKGLARSSEALCYFGLIGGCCIVFCCYSYYSSYNNYCGDISA